MEFQYYIPDHGETEADAQPFYVTGVYTEYSAVIQICEHRFANHWDYVCPPSMVIRIPGEPWKTFNLDVRTVPEFSAREVQP